ASAISGGQVNLKSARLAWRVAMVTPLRVSVSPWRSVTVVLAVPDAKFAQQGLRIGGLLCCGREAEHRMAELQMIVAGAGRGEEAGDRVLPEAGAVDEGLI